MKYWAQTEKKAEKKRRVCQQTLPRSKTKWLQKILKSLKQLQLVHQRNNCLQYLLQI